MMAMTTRLQLLTTLPVTRPVVSQLGWLRLGGASLIGARRKALSRPWHLGQRHKTPQRVLAASTKLGQAMRRLQEVLRWQLREASPGMPRAAGDRQLRLLQPGPRLAEPWQLVGREAAT